MPDIEGTQGGSNTAPETPANKTYTTKEELAAELEALQAQAKTLSPTKAKQIADTMEQMEARYSQLEEYYANYDPDHPAPLPSPYTHTPSSPLEETLEFWEKRGYEEDISTMLQQTSMTPETLIQLLENDALMEGILEMYPSLMLDEKEMAWFKDKKNQDKLNALLNNPKSGVKKNLLLSGNPAVSLAIAQMLLIKLLSQEHEKERMYTAEQLKADYEGAKLEAKLAKEEHEIKAMQHMTNAFTSGLQAAASGYSMYGNATAGRKADAAAKNDRPIPEHLKNRQEGLVDEDGNPNPDLTPDQQGQLAQVNREIEPYKLEQDKYARTFMENEQYKVQAINQIVTNVATTGQHAANAAFETKLGEVAEESALVRQLRTIYAKMMERAEKDAERENALITDFVREMREQQQKVHSSSAFSHLRG